ncbi:MAG: hypothetical protein JXR70_12995 [Spirochaetales bacterium]|nr:hypothetical protein [Spirochaetales bacterium]
MNIIFKPANHPTPLRLFMLFMALSSNLATAQWDDRALKIDSSLNFIFLELLEESDPSEAYRYITIILDRLDYDINDFLKFCCYFTTKKDQELKESLLLRLLNWFFEGKNEIESIEKTLYNSESLDFIISRLNHFKSSSLCILVIKLAALNQSEKNFRHIDMFVTEKIKKYKEKKLNDQDYYPLMLSFLELAQNTMSPIFFYNVETLYYENRSNRLTLPARNILKLMLGQ